MFYSPLVLSEKNSLGKIWLAAHFEKKLTKAQVLETDIAESCKAITDKSLPMALRLSGQLLLGVARIYGKKVEFLFVDCNDALSKIKMAFRPEVATTVPAASITLPEVSFEDHEVEDVYFSNKNEDGMVAVEFNLKHTAREPTAHTLLQEPTPGPDWSLEDLGLGGNFSSQGLGGDEPYFFDPMGGGEDDQIDQFRKSADPVGGDSFTSFEQSGLGLGLGGEDEEREELLKGELQKEVGEDGDGMMGAPPGDISTIPFPDDELAAAAGGLADVDETIEESQPLAPIPKRVPQSKKKRKAVVVDDLTVQVDAVKNQKDTSDIVLDTDLAPPTKRRMLEEHRYEMLFSSSVSSHTHDLPRSLHSLFEVPAPSETVDDSFLEIGEFRRGEEDTSLQVQDSGLGLPLEDEYVEDMSHLLPSAGDKSNLSGFPDESEGGLGEVGSLLLAGGEDEEVGGLEITGEEDKEELTDKQLSRQNWTKYTGKVHEFLKEHFDRTQNRPISFEKSTAHLEKRGVVAGMFFELLVLQNSGAIEVAQQEPYGDIQLRPTEEFGFQSPLVNV